MPVFLRTLNSGWERRIKGLCLRVWNWLKDRQILKGLKHIKFKINPLSLDKINY